MTGKYNIEIYNSTVHYFLTVQRNITVLQGNSASGKTELIRLMTEYNRSKESSGITLLCEKVCTVLTAEDWQIRITGMKDRIIFIDEGNDFVKTREFAEVVSKSDNYFVIINRDSLKELPYSICEIYGLKETSASKYKNAERVYNEMFQLYTSYTEMDFQADHIITEDSQSGFQFFNTAYPEITESARGNANVLSCLRRASEEDKTSLAIVDGAAFGANMAEIYEWLKWNPHNAIFAPESFEYLILISGILDVQKTILEKTYNFADSCRYMSWEQFFTDYLTQITLDSNHPYKKSKLARFYITKKNIKRILQTLPPNLHIICEKG